MAQRAVAIATRYSTCLSNACDSDFFSTGRASWQPPFAARSMACSAEVETAAAGDNFRGTWAKRGAAVRIAPNRPAEPRQSPLDIDRKSTRLNSSHTVISYAVFCLKKKIMQQIAQRRPAIHKDSARITRETVHHEHVMQDAVSRLYRKLQSYDDNLRMVPRRFRLAQ